MLPFAVFDFTRIGFGAFDGALSEHPAAQGPSRQIGRFGQSGFLSHLELLSDCWTGSI